MRKAAFLLAAAIMLSAAGCGEKSDSSVQSSKDTTSQAETSEDTQDAGIPEEVLERLRAAAEAEPKAVPEGGWTDSELMDVFYINGEKVSWPLTVSSLGESFGILTDEENFLPKEDTTGAVITYYGTVCGMGAVNGVVDPEAFMDKDLYMIMFKDIDSDNVPEMFPVSLNGVTYGTSYEDMVARLGWTAEDIEPGETEPTTVVRGHTENFDVHLYIAKGLINGIDVTNITDRNG
ncbi:MAG: hypothetical protein IJ071_10170 [Ruminococcus sp.]|nr:hypothetical protein [Ruminococcus sp.]